MTLTFVLFVVGAYLWGAIPSAYLVVRYKAGVDIRKYGSGNVGASNVTARLGKRAGLLLGTFDCLAKGTLPVMLGNLLDQSLATQVAVALAAIVGHNWSIYIGFTGGRGVATAIGVLFGFALWYELLALSIVLGLIGRLILKDTAFWTLMSMLSLPLLVIIFQRPTEILVMSLAIGLLLIAKRLTTNWEKPTGNYPLIQVMLFRILWDRDVPKREEWTKRMSQ